MKSIVNSGPKFLSPMKSMLDWAICWGIGILESEMGVDLFPCSKLLKKFGRRSLYRDDFAECSLPRVRCGGWERDCEKLATWKALYNYLFRELCKLQSKLDASNARIRKAHQVYVVEIEALKAERDELRRENAAKSVHNHGLVKEIERLREVVREAINGKWRTQQEQAAWLERAREVLGEYQNPTG